MSSDLPTIAIADPDRLAQLLGNLLGNAIKFTGRGAVELEAWLDPAGRLVLAVSDTGPGIDPDRADLLFQPFSRLDASDSRTSNEGRGERVQGTGLGLAICRRLAEAMGGSVDLLSQPGRGSRFTLRLPLPGMAPAAPRSSELLAGLRLGAALAAPEMRILLRLARRWRIDLSRVDGDDIPGDFDLLLTAPEVVSTQSLARWINAGVDGLWLAADRAPPLGMTRLRPPLTEARLLGALFELRLSSARSA